MSGNSVFYAWQSDLHSKCNHYFIRDAADAAIRSLKAELSVEEAPRLDHDTKDVPGIPDIARTILEKIDACDVFLADVSLVGVTKAGGEKTKPKMIPNPNAMLELGYALKTLGGERVVLVMNTAFGGPEELPFDLRTRRHPIQYALKHPDDPDRSTILKGLTDQLKVAFRAIIQGAPPTVRNADIGAARRAAVEARMKVIRERFTDDALSGRFNKFDPDRGVVLLTLIPEALPNPLLSFGDTRWQSVRVATIAGGPQPGDIHGRKLAVADRDRGSGKVFSSSELREDGSILAADGYLRGEPPTDKFEKKYGRDVSGYVPSIAFEQYSAEAVRHNLRALRNAGIRGPVQVSMSLFRVQGFVMGVGERTMFLHRAGRKFEGTDGIRPDPFVVAEGKEPETLVEAAESMKPSFDLIWREFGYAGSLNFDQTGNWNPK